MPDAHIQVDLNQERGVNRIKLWRGLLSTFNFRQRIGADRLARCPPLVDFQA